VGEGTGWEWGREEAASASPVNFISTRTHIGLCIEKKNARVIFFFVINQIHLHQKHVIGMYAGGKLKSRARLEPRSVRHRERGDRKQCRHTPGTSERKLATQRQGIDVGNKETFNKRERTKE
jgi:hypothetical protein